MDTQVEHRGKHARQDSHPPPWLQLGGEWGFRFVFLMGGIGLILYALNQLRIAVLPVLIALLLTTLVAPLAGLLTKWRLPRGIASAVSVLLGLGALVGMGILIGIAVAGEFSELGSSAERGYRQFVGQAAKLMGVAPDQVKGWVDSHLSQLQSSGGIARTAMTQVRGMMQSLTIVTLTVVFTFLFSWDGKQQFEKLVSLLPERRRAGATELGQRVWTAVGGYMRGMFVIATADALLLGLGYWIIGLPLVPPLMLVMFLGAFVPFLGPIIAASLAALVGMAEGDLTLAALAVGIAFIVQQIEGNLLHPFVMGRAVELHPTIILFAVTAGGVLGGVAGILLAVPIATTLATSFDFFRERSAPSAPSQEVKRAA